MKHFLSFCCITAALLFFVPATAMAQDAEVIYVPEQYEFQKGVRVRGKTKEECNIQTHLASYMADGARKVYSKVVRERPKSGKYHVLEVEITEAQGAGGGAWSGPKNMSCQGKLLDQDGKRIGDFTMTRFTTGGFMAGVKGTCTMFKRISKAFGKDISIFLADPDTALHFGD
jgi:hypothetical protein